MSGKRCAGDKTGQYKGVLDCFAKSYRQGGLMTFYNGFLPNFARLGSWNCAMFLTVEQVSTLLAGLAAQSARSLQSTAEALNSQLCICCTICIFYNNNFVLCLQVKKLFQ